MRTVDSGLVLCKKNTSIVVATENFLIYNLTKKIINPINNENLKNALPLQIFCREEFMETKKLIYNFVKSDSQIRRYTDHKLKLDRLEVNLQAGNIDDTDDMKRLDQVYSWVIQAAHIFHRFTCFTQISVFRYIHLKQIDNFIV